MSPMTDSERWAVDTICHRWNDDPLEGMKGADRILNCTISNRLDLVAVVSCETSPFLLPPAVSSHRRRGNPTACAPKRAAHEHVRKKATVAERLHSLQHHAPVDDVAGRCVVVDGPNQAQELVNGVKIDFENPQWMIIVRLPDGRHAITKMMPEELVSTLQVILSKKVQALHTSESHQLLLVMRGRQLDEDIQLQEVGLTNCSLIHLVLPHWDGGGSGKN